MTSTQLTDDYVAKLLADDAKKRSSRLSAYGLQDDLPRRPTINAPKPNTRFLKNIIRETDSHNATLRAKELRESRARLGGSNKPQRPARSEDNATNRKRRREKDDTDAYRRDSRRLRYEDEEESEDSESRKRRYRKHRHGEHREQELHRRHRGRHRDHHSHDRPSNPRHRRRDSLNTSRSPSTRPRPSHKDEPYHGSHPRSRSLNKTTDEELPRKRRDREEPCLTTRAGHDNSAAEDSDPLEHIIGPRPPPEPELRSRGRGTGTAMKSRMDSHFANDYDPSNDVEPEAEIEHDDWDQALEALRDRQKWQQRGAERLRAAGFSEDAVSKWASGKQRGPAIERDEDEVRWKGKGEGREWDRGKVMTSNGQ